MSDVIRVIQYGLGPIGSATARLITERDNLALVGAVDIAPEKVGRDVGALIGLGRELGVEVAPRLEEVDAEGDVVVHATSSHFELFLHQLLEILGAGFDIVSTSEELSFPWRDHADRAAEGRMGHVGLLESAAMLFDTLGRKLVRFESTVEPILAEAPERTEYFDVPAGRVRGLLQTGHAFADDDEFVTLTFRAALNEEPEGDTIRISGCPDLAVTPRGTNGDLATVAIAVNAIHRTKEAPPGLLTMRDIPIVTVSDARRAKAPATRGGRT